jgi:DNA-binding transcriptional ArsR family regulator
MTRAGNRPGRPSSATKPNLLCDPTRVAVLSSLAWRPQSARQVAAELDLPIEKVRYQLKRLREQGIVVLHGERPRRGTVEGIYKADARLGLDYESQLVAESGDPRAFEDMGFRIIFKEVLDAIVAGAFRAGREYTLARMPLTLDEQGHAEIEAIFTAAVTRLSEISKESFQRMEASGEAPISTLSALVHFERPRHSRGLSSRE